MCLGSYCQNDIMMRLLTTSKCIQMHTLKPLNNSAMQWYVTKYCLSVQKHCEIFLMHRGLIMRVNVLLHSCEWKKPIVASCINPRPHCQSLGEQDRPPGAPPTPRFRWPFCDSLCWPMRRRITCFVRIDYPTVCNDPLFKRLSEAPNCSITAKTAVLNEWITALQG